MVCGSEPDTLGWPAFCVTGTAALLTLCGDLGGNTSDVPWVLALLLVRGLSCPAPCSGTAAAFLECPAATAAAVPAAVGFLEGAGACGSDGDVVGQDDDVAGTAGGVPLPLSCRLSCSGVSSLGGVWG
jgi:hypothetical protein